MKRLTLLISICFLFLNTFGFTDKMPIKWGKISKSEFEINSFRGDTTVPAIILCDFGNIRITNRTIYTYHKRIRINRPEGIRFSRIEIPFRYKDNHDDIMEFKANVYRYQDGSIRKSSYRLKDAAIIPLNSETKIIVLEIPEVKPGCIIEYFCEIASLDFVKLDEWYFQSEIPTLWSEIRFDVPLPFHYLVTYQRGEFLSKDEQIIYAEQLQWLYNANRIKRRTRMARQNHLLYQSPSKNYKVFLLNNMKKKIVMKNLPGMVKVDGYVSVKDYYPKLRFDLYESSGHLPWFYRSLIMTATDDYESRSRREWMYSNRMHGYVQYRLDTWDEFNRKLLENKRFGLQLVRHLDHVPLFKEILQDDMSNTKKMEALFNHVQESYHWNGQYRIYASRELNKIPDNGAASSGEINLILVYLLRRAGLDADPVLIRTNNLGQPETAFPVHNQFNHVIAMVNLDGEVFLLDAIDDDNPFHVLPANDLYTVGWKVHKDDFGWIDIHPM